MSKDAAIDAAVAAIMVRGEGPIVLRQFAKAIVEAAAPHLQEDAWDEGYRAGWGDRTRSILERRTYEEEVAKATPNPYRSVSV
ncbi:hypothetical protein HOU49_gp42 [Arthrobacter phage Eileen]|uniref:Uncharacterized protein n=1 Tax=Arthrobacter phage Eileen TaxID=2419956 RepID=A0A3G2KFW3_9CAUD|nr:hypothetical protein HOU49_gp42 [Arthrobacter phage Eileen]AYN57831.1 hypothetical protein PBI_EILEEN_42 [Arthrobacter phage Eileen]